MKIRAVIVDKLPKKCHWCALEDRATPPVEFYYCVATAIPTGEVRLKGRNSICPLMTAQEWDIIYQEEGE